MHPVQVQLDDQHYKKALERATQAGFRSVEEYVADIITNDLDDVPENIDHLFTPERLAMLDAALAEVKAGGKTYTVEETNTYLAEQRAEWLRNNPQ